MEVITALDNDIAALTAQLQEIRVFNKQSKGKHALNNLPDHEIASSAFHSEVEQTITSLLNLRIAHYIANDLPIPAAIEHASILDDELNGISALSIIDQEDEDDPLVGLPGPSTTAPTSHCVACYSQLPLGDIIRTPCGDHYCGDCLKELFLLATKDENYFPPRCCRQKVPIELITPVLSPEELKAFQSASIEFTTKNRLYCSNVGCGKFLAPPTASGLDVVTCDKCLSQTCIQCKKAEHTGDCPEDEALQATLVLAAEMNWQRCNACKSMIELDTGCYHMRCKCGHQFCYICGVEWKKCRCAQWDENRLVARANVIVNREPAGRRRMAPAERAQRMGVVRQELIERHQCTHPRRLEKIERQRPEHGANWPGFQCEMCNSRLFYHILRCTRCHIQVCDRCRRNRIAARDDDDDDDVW
ncbi:hypothetical protein BT63DRAFT_444285 [Microthyrium microscopicum]|uniref:RBR-type E3 ubiquitin transferase n=1 Tax=Microthyrium microscopicum TaxID=703497 RepID=A0A6A6TYR4_9PEZI|nr:hypothetical protein BT63DRAFT_444285 [Microthyrium microscopicum]